MYASLYENLLDMCEEAVIHRANRDEMHRGIEIAMRPSVAKQLNKYAILTKDGVSVPVIESPSLLTKRRSNGEGMSLVIVRYVDTQEEIQGTYVKDKA
jgi:hypothetical protein